MLRGGLTPKHVDVPELVKVLSFNTVADPRVKLIDRSDSERVSGAKALNYPVPVGEYSLTRCELKSQDEVVMAHEGPAVILCTEGVLHLAAEDGITLELEPSAAAWVPATDGHITMTTSTNAQAFIARV